MPSMIRMEIHHCVCGGLVLILGLGCSGRSGCATADAAHAAAPPETTMSARPTTRRSLLGATFLGLAAATGLALAQQPAGQPIRVGSTLALTGPLSATAQIHRIVGEIYVEQANR